MSNFKLYETFIKDLYIVDHIELSDRKIIYDQKVFINNGLTMSFIQDNESYSKKNVLRGLHIQIKKPQGKLVWVEKGKIFDVAVDLRNNSTSFGKWVGILLSDDNKKSFYIPEGFAHGFCVLSDFAKISFKVTNLWDPKDEVGIPWDDPYINIKWPIDTKKIIIAEKDNNYKNLIDNELFRR